MKILQKTYNTIRVLSSEMIADKQIGDVRSCLACAPAMFTLFREHYNFFGGKEHVNRDRFVLADVGLMPLYYTLLHCFGINLEIDDLKKFGDENSKTPATPNISTLGVDATITSKGQGIPTAIGLAIASQSLASKFNAQKFNVISNYTYCFVSISNLQEGVSQEAMALAGSLKISKLILLCNYVQEQVDGERLKDKYKAMGWNVLTVSSKAKRFFLTSTINKAKQSQKPTLILLKNTLVEDFPDIQNRFISKNEVEKMKADFGFNGAYKIDNDVMQYCARTTRKLRVEYGKWEKKVVIYRNTHPQLSEELNEYFVKPKLTFAKSLKQKLENEQSLSESNKIIMNYIRDYFKCVMVASIKEKFLPILEGKEKRIFSKKDYRAQNLVFGNRENAMAEICSGISLYYSAPTYVFAPICFFGQMLSGIEHSAMSNLPTVFVFYQSGKCVDQQKTNLELYGQFEWLGNIKNLDVFQPATSVELLACHSLIYERSKTACLVLPQQTYPLVATNFELAKKGAFVVEGEQKSDFTIVASGRELHVAMALKEQLASSKKTTKIVSVPSWNVFNEQNAKYKESVIGTNDNVVCLTRADNTSALNIKVKSCKYININEFTSTPEFITSELVKSIKKVLLSK